MGAGRVAAAQKAALVGFSLGVGQGLITAVVAFAARHVWAYSFTSEVEVVDYLAEIMPFLCVLTILDATVTVLSGTPLPSPTLCAIRDLDDAAVPEGLKSSLA